MEIEKSLGGVQSSDRVDGGTGSAMFGQLLTWMQESKSPRYIVATANDMEPLLAISQGALLRRFDDIFFVDLPNKEERKEIIQIQNKKYKAAIPEEWCDVLKNYTGAEIEKICKSSLYEGAETALKLTKTVYNQNRSVIDRMRTWAKDNARPANAGAVMQEGGTRKLVSRKKLKPGKRPAKKEEDTNEHATENKVETCR